MRLRSRPGLALWAALGLWSPVGAQDISGALTEAEAVARFHAESPEVRALRRRVVEQAQQNRTRALVANPVLWYTQENAAGVRDDFLAFRQPIPVTGRRGLFETANEAATTSVEASVAHRIWALEADVRAAFAALLRAQEREEALDAALADIGETVRVLEAREREGEGSRFDRLRGERELDELRTTRAGAEIDRARAQASLATRIGLRVA